MLLFQRLSVNSPTTDDELLPVRDDHALVYYFLHTTHARQKYKAQMAFEMKARKQ